MLAFMQDAEAPQFMSSPLVSRVCDAVRGASEQATLEATIEATLEADFEPTDVAERTRTGQRAGVGSHALLKEKSKVKPPPLYKVMLLNDDYTPMEFVVGVLQALFKRSHQEAVLIMLQVHKKGVGICGRYPYDIAETKAVQVVGAARASEHPLQCVIEKDQE